MPAFLPAGPHYIPDVILPSIQASHGSLRTDQTLEEKDYPAPSDVEEDPLVVDAMVFYAHNYAP